VSCEHNYLSGPLLCAECGRWVPIAVREAGKMVAQETELAELRRKLEAARKIALAESALSRPANAVAEIAALLSGGGGT
jgi:hypothetical protein